MTSKVATLLDAAGSKIKEFFEKAIPEADAVAKDVEPIVDLAFPGIAALFNSTVAAVGTAEATGLAASANPSASNSQKLASVVASISPIATAYLAQNNIKVNTTQITAWVNAVVAAINTLPPPTAPAAS